MREERGYFVCTHADILPTRATLPRLVVGKPWGRGQEGDKGGRGIVVVAKKKEFGTLRSILAPPGPE